MCKGVLCYLEPSIVFKAKVARHVRTSYKEYTYNYKMTVVMPENDYNEC